MLSKPLLKGKFWISKELIEIVEAYKKKFPDLFSFTKKVVLKNKNAIFERFKFKASKIFDVPENQSNIELVKAYLWVIKNGKVDLKFRSISTSIIPLQKVS